MVAFDDPGTLRRFSRSLNEGWNRPYKHADAYSRPRLSPASTPSNRP